MRVKAALMIVAIVIAATTANYLSSLGFTDQSLYTTMARDQALVRDIADSYIGAQIDMLNREAAEVTRSLRGEPESGWQVVIDLMLYETSDFTALYVFSPEELLLYTGVSGPQFPGGLNDIGLQKDFDGEAGITTTMREPGTGELVFYLYTPIRSDRVLVAVLPGSYFADLLSGYRLWDTGSIFIIDYEGALVAHYEREWVEERLNFIDLGKTDADTAEAGAFFEWMLSNPEGTGIYPLHGQDRLCSFKHITNPAVDWVIAVIAPLNESPRANVQQGLLTNTLIFIVAGLLIAFFLSGIVARPFMRIEAQNAALEELNKKVSEQSARLQDEHERTKLLFDETPLACSLWNAQYEMFLCNDECVNLFEVRDKQEFMDVFFELVSPEFQSDGSRTEDLVRELIDRVFAEGRITTEWMHQTKDRKPLPVEVTLVPVEYEGKGAIAGYVRDMREYKEMMRKIEESEEQLKDALEFAQNANEAKSEFLAKMSHEMRTPLNAIIGLSALALEDDELTGDNKDNIIKVNNAGSALLTTVNDILDISKIEAGRYELVPSEYNIASLINDVASQSSIFLGEKPIVFVLKIDEDLPKTLYGDELRVKQVLNNLLSNAFKYTKKGSVTFYVGCETSGGDVLLKANVSDTGIGIKPEDLESLFDDYAQLDQKKNRGVIGSGLGLSIVQKLIDLMDGTISVESDYGKGSVFSTTIPQKSVDSEPIGAEIAKSLADFKYTEQKRRNDSKLSRISLPYAKVLVVDDVATNLDVAKGIMKPYGMTVDCLLSGQQAVDAIRDEKVLYDAVFIDQMMPGIDGIETARLIREIGTDYAKNIPLIALTANALVGSETLFLENGFQAFISKPIELSRLDAVIREFLYDKGKEEEFFEERKRAGAAPVPASGGSGSERRAVSERRSGIERRALHRGIDGVEIEKGIEHFGSDEDAYYEVLRSFAVNTPQLLESSKGVGEYNLNDYAIIVHGIKGSSRGIFANDFGDIAESLEMAARGGDIKYVRKNNPLFLEAGWNLLADIDKFLAGIRPEGVKPRLEKPSGEILGKLLEACRNYDMDGADVAIAELEGWEYDEGGELVAWLWENVQQMNFSGIIERLSELD